MRKTRIASHVVAVMAIALGGSLAACGSSSKSTSAKTKDTTASTSSPSSNQPGASAAVVTAKKDTKLGVILADDKGMTVYTLTKDGKPVACTGPCLTAWPPLVLPGSSAAPTGSSGITGLSVVAGPNGARLVAVKGAPLYRFIQDKDAGDAYGDGVQSFGGVWHVAKTSAQPSAPAEDKGAATTTPTTEATTGSNGY